MVLRMDPTFRWAPKEEVRAGVLGTATGTTREFEAIAIDLGADRSVLTAAQRAAYEAYRFTHEVARGELAAIDTKADGTVVRLKLRDAVYAAATRQLGRTVVFARGEAPRKDEAALVKLVRGAVGWVVPAGDDVDGWIPKEVKATWTRAPSADLLVVDDGTLDPAVRDAALKIVRDAHGVVRRLLAGANVGPTPPVVRVTKNREMLGYLSGRRELRSLDAAYVPWAAELLVAPRKPEIDAPQLAQEAAAQACHHLLGSAEGDPFVTGLRRAAAAVADGGAVGALFRADEPQIFARVKARQGMTLAGLLRLSNLDRFLAEDADDRTLDAELAVDYLLASPSPLGKAGLAAWATSMRKVGHPDAASEAAYGALDVGKADAEFWAYWSLRADPPKKPGKPK
jgi:hypothetical protein